MYLAKQANSKPVCADATDDESKLHDEIIQYCRANGFYYVHSRMDRKSTNGVGTADFIIALPNGVTAWIECKAKNRKQSTEQLAAEAWLKKLGHNYHLVRSLSEFLEAVGS